jgi:outer membrane protein assembly factor BamB
MDANETKLLEPAGVRSPTPRLGVRWWPALAIVGIALAVEIWIWFFEDTYRQRRFLQSLPVCIVTMVLLLGWCLLLSRLRWRIRVAVLGCLVVLIASAAMTLRIRGVTGDVLPVFEWRWTKRPLLTAKSELNAPLTSGSRVQPLPAAVPDGWPQFLGPNRNGILSGPRLARDWVARPPELIWRQPIGAAWSGFVVSRGFAVTQEQRGTQELVTCYEAITGKLLWMHADETRYANTIAGEGPRANPAIDEDRVITAGASGILNCLELHTGKLLWSHNVTQENGGEVPGWGYSISPLVLGELVVVAAGGSEGKSLVAYRKATGQLEWSGGNDPVGYSSPVVHQIGGLRQILLFGGREINGHDASSGALLWHLPWPTDHPHVGIPLPLSGDRVLIASGYGTGCAAFQIRHETNGGWIAMRVWKSVRMKPKFTNLVQRDGFIYGLDDGILACLDATTGEQKWKDGRYGHGQIILVGDLLLVSAENGQIVLVEPVPQEHRQLARYSVLKSKTWNPPALAGEFLFMRNDLEAACLRLPLEK